MKFILAISIVVLSFFGTACRRSVGEMILVPVPQESTLAGGYFETDSARFVQRAGDGYVVCRIDPSAPDISSSTVISYRGQRRGIEAANCGYDVVMSPGEVLYFDWYQGDPRTQPRAMGGFSPIRKIYGFHPVPDTPATAADNESIVRSKFVSPDSVEYIYDGGQGHVIGVQGCTWTEFIETEKHLEYMIFPRLLAVSELAWMPRERREWNDLRRHINVHVSLLHARGINAFPLSGDVVITAHALSGGKRARVTLDVEKYPAEVRYTLDGTDPIAGSDLYDGPFVVKAGTTVRAALFSDGKAAGNVAELYAGTRRHVDNYYTYLDTPEVYASTDL